MDHPRMFSEARDESELIAESEASVDERLASLQYLVVELLATNERLRQQVAGIWPHDIAL